MRRRSRLRHLIVDSVESFPLDGAIKGGSHFADSLHQIMLVGLDPIGPWHAHRLRFQLHRVGHVTIDGNGERVQTGADDAVEGIDQLRAIAIWRRLESDSVQQHTNVVAVEPGDVQGEDHGRTGRAAQRQDCEVDAWDDLEGARIGGAFRRVSEHDANAINAIGQTRWNSDRPLGIGAAGIECGQPGRGSDTVETNSLW